MIDTKLFVAYDAFCRGVAWRDGKEIIHEVTTSIGLAAQKGHWNLEHDALSDLRNFIKKLAD